MNLQEKYKYYCHYYEEDGILEGISATDFFTLDFINYLKEKSIVTFTTKDLITLLKSTEDKEFLRTIANVFLFESVNIIGSMDDIARDLLASEIFINNIIDVLNNSNNKPKPSNLLLIFENDTLRNAFFEHNITQPEKLTNIFISIYPANIIDILLKYDVVIKALLSIDLYSFMSFCERHATRIDLTEYIDYMFNKASFAEKIHILEKTYKADKGEPSFLQSYYYQYEEVLKLRQIRETIINIVKYPTEENINQARKLINTPEGYEILTSEILEPTFSQIVELLGLDPSVHKTRKEKLLDKLSNYKEYEEDVIKNLFCIYCFDDVSLNIKLRLQTIIEFIQTKPEIVGEFKEQIPYINRLYNFLNNKGLSESPLDLINYLDIKGILARMHEIFSEEANKKTDITDILVSSPRKIINNVSVIDVDIPLDRSFFLIHSISGYDVGDNPLEKYKEGAQKNNRICTSILDNNHTGTYTKGVVFGYCNIKAPLYSAIPGDGQTNQWSKGAGIPQYRSVLSGVDRFVHRTVDKYNELTYITNNELIMPSYIFVADREPNELDYKAAQSFNIPILIYRTKKIDYEYEPVVIREAFDYNTNTIDYVRKPETKELNI